MVDQYSVIPFHSQHDFDDQSFAGYVVIPHLSRSATPNEVLADLVEYKDKLDYLKLVAPGPPAQRKYIGTINWVSNLRTKWQQAMSGWWPD